MSSCIPHTRGDEPSSEDFDHYERMLPGNPNTIFLKGVALEGMQDRKRAAEEFHRYL